MMDHFWFVHLKQTEDHSGWANTSSRSANFTDRSGMHIGKGKVQLGPNQLPCKSKAVPTGYAFSVFPDSLSDQEALLTLLLGHEEVILIQNYLAPHPATPKQVPQHP